jgi:hypothetical protein
MKLVHVVASVALLAGCKAAGPGTNAEPGGNYFPIAGYRIGPYAAGGSGLVSGVWVGKSLVGLPLEMWEQGGE